MIGIVLVTHGDLGRALLSALIQIAGPQEQMMAVSPDANHGTDQDKGDGMDQSEHEIARACEQVDQGSGVLILTDVFGGTPANLSMRQLVPGKIEVVSGVNMPMLVKLSGDRKHMSLIDAAEEARKTAQKSIMIASQHMESPYVNPSKEKTLLKEK